MRALPLARLSAELNRPRSEAATLAVFDGSKMLLFWKERRPKLTSCGRGVVPLCGDSLPGLIYHFRNRRLIDRQISKLSDKSDKPMWTPATSSFVGVRSRVDSKTNKGWQSGVYPLSPLRHLISCLIFCQWLRAKPAPHAKLLIPQDGQLRDVTVCRCNKENGVSA
jgi:hypothetical protein